MNKKELREEMKEKLSLLEKPQYEDKSYNISQRLFKLPCWTRANTIGITISNPPEVDTYRIIRKAWELGKRVAVPKCDPGSKRMIFRVLNQFSHLEKVFFGLYEPIVAITGEAAREEIDLLIVPGLAFSRDGFRLGFGGGYYDRYLTDFQGSKISLAFTEQIVSSLPVEKHDIPVTKIITEDEVIETC